MTQMKKYKAIECLAKIENYNPTVQDTWHDNVFLPTMGLKKLFACNDYYKFEISYMDKIDSIFNALGCDKNNFDVSVSGVFLSLKNKDENYYSYVLQPVDFDKKIGLAVCRTFNVNYRYLKEPITKKNYCVSYINKEYQEVFEL